MVMNDEYLWDRNGRDPLVERLERLLAPLAHRPAPRRILPRLCSSIAALLLIGISAWLVVPAGAQQQRTISIGSVGEVLVEPGARVTVIDPDAAVPRLRLELGTIHATISSTAPVRSFQVETPASTCIDLGCAYTLTVGPDGNTDVEVRTGAVAFADGEREVWVPAGARCRAVPGRGAGLPVWQDADSGLVEAVRRIEDAVGTTRVANATALTYRCHRRRDALTLWHLLVDHDAAVVGVGLEHVPTLCAPPSDVSPEAIRSRDPQAIRRWRASLAETLAVQ
jgi:hypothetical protein